MNIAEKLDDSFTFLGIVTCMPVYLYLPFRNDQELFVTHNSLVGKRVYHKTGYAIATRGEIGYLLISHTEEQRLIQKQPEEER